MELLQDHFIQFTLGVEEKKKSRKVTASSSHGNYSSVTLCSQRLIFQKQLNEVGWWRLATVTSWGRR